MIELVSPELRVVIAPHGARIARLCAPDRDGRPGEVVVGLAEADYQADLAYLGAVVGRYANRIAGGEFVLDGRRHRLPRNEPTATLHGGPGAFDHADWVPGPVAAVPGGTAVTLRHTSPDGENGFPGTLAVTATYTVRGPDLAIDLTATTDAPTVVNLTHHAYLNLRGAPGGIEDHEITVLADGYLPVDDALIPTGVIAAVAGTALDLSAPTKIGARWRHASLRAARGFDHCYVLHGRGPRSGAATGDLPAAAHVVEPVSGPHPHGVHRSAGPAVLLRQPARRLPRHPRRAGRTAGRRVLPRAAALPRLTQPARVPQHRAAPGPRAPHPHPVPLRDGQPPLNGERMRLTRILTAAAASVLAVSLAACGSATKTADQAPAAGSGSAAGGLVGVTMPTKSSERWIHDGDNIKAALEKLGYQVDLQYAENDIPTQVNQIENQITKGAKLLIVASIDGTAITTQLQEAADKKIPVIAYDRLIRNSANVNYYATFDNFKVGVEQATSLLVGLGLKKEDGTDGTAAGPFNVELFAGSPDDNNATFFFNGAMSVLKPLVDKGTLVVKSGQTDFKTVAILRWDPATAQKRMEDLLTSGYTGGAKVNGVLSPYDGLSIGILSALKSNGYGTAGQPYPTVTGQDAEVASVKSIIAGEQFATIYKDTRQLADVTVKMADATLKGGTPEVNNTTDYDNGVKVVPSFLLQPVVVYKDNYQKELVDSGYYTASQLS